MSGSPLDGFRQIVGDRYFLTSEEDKENYVRDQRGRYDTNCRAVLRPSSVEEVSQIMALASQHRIPVIPQGGNTGLVGAGIPLVEGGGEEVILSLGRMNQILDVCPQSNTMTVEAGAVLADLQKAADDHDRLFPLSLGAQGSCQIGGNIGSNAGGTGVLAYGNTRELVMGLEVVLPDGRVWNGLSRLRKDNTGFDLKNLFVGAEGTLGVVTKAVLKLFPKPRGQEVAIAGLTSPENALSLLNLAQGRAGSALTAFEFMAQIAMDFALQYMPDVKPPLQGNHPWSVLLEISSGRSAEQARSLMEEILADAFEQGLIEDATISQSQAQQAAMWSLRENISPAQKPHGASIKHDISVPVADIPAFIEAADQAVLDLVPGARIVNFGHMGDGNLHYNISQPVGWEAEAFFEFEPSVHEAVYDAVTWFNGSISAEHGIGQMKRDKLASIKDPVALAMMRQIKASLDPHGIMNPGKVI